MISGHFKFSSAAPNLNCSLNWEVICQFVTDVLVVVLYCDFDVIHMSYHISKKFKYFPTCLYDSYHFINRITKQYKSLLINLYSKCISSFPWVTALSVIWNHFSLQLAPRCQNYFNLLLLLFCIPLSLPTFFFQVFTK